MADSEVRNRVTDLLGSVMTILMRTCSSLQYWWSCGLHHWLRHSTASPGQPGLRHLQGV
jgi:hypothetical protein